VKDTTEIGVHVASIRLIVAILFVEQLSAALLRRSRPRLRSSEETPMRSDNGKPRWRRFGMNRTAAAEIRLVPT
jgi:hypothetical protein